MHDPVEGVTESGTITTGAGRDRVPAVFEPVLEVAAQRVRAAGADTSLYVYGSVATGMAQPGVSDVDLLTIGLSPDPARAVGRDLAQQFADLCRGVEVASARRRDFLGNSDAAYGGRVFLKHYCVHLAGPDLHTALREFPADVRAARAFNGDIADHAVRWRTELGSGADPGALGRRLARKTLLAVAGLVSMHDGTWTTDRAGGATRWAEIEPPLMGALHTLITWSNGDATPDGEAVRAALRGVVASITSSFEHSIGLWGSSGSG